MSSTCECSTGAARTARSRRRSNTKSVFYLTVALLPLLKKGKSVEQPAQVINISSIYGSLPHANMPTAKVGHGAWSYLSSKAATSHLTRVLAAKLKPGELQRAVSCFRLLTLAQSTSTSTHSHQDSSRRP